MVYRRVDGGVQMQTKRVTCPCGLPLRHTKNKGWQCLPCERRRRTNPYRLEAYQQWKSLNRALSKTRWKISLELYTLVLDEISKHTPRTPKEIRERVQEKTSVTSRTVYRALEVGLVKGDIKREGPLKKNGIVDHEWGGGYLRV